MKKSLLFSCVLVLTSVMFAACGGGSENTEGVMADSTVAVATDSVNFGPLNRLNLNTATAEEFAMIPGIGETMVQEFQEYRPFVSIEQFRAEMLKYIDAETLAGYETFLYVPVDFNNSDVATVAQIPGVTPELAQVLIDARPYESQEAFIAKVTEVAGGVSDQFARHYLVQE